MEDVRKREASLREVAEQMKASLEDATREQRRLAEEKKRLEEELVPSGCRCARRRESRSRR